jgi:hypothetical protein
VADAHVVELNNVRHVLAQLGALAVVVLSADAVDEDAGDLKLTRTPKHAW